MVITAILAGAGAGLLGGLLGVGGGIILVPLLSGPLKLTQHQAHGTSLAVIMPIAFFGALPYFGRGQIDGLLIASLALGSGLGTVLGARATTRISGPRLRQMFGVFMILVGLRLFIWG